MAPRLTPASPPFDIDLTTEKDAEVYTSGYAFHQNLLRHQNQCFITRISTYNVGINVETSYLHSLVQKLRGDVRMLVGHNPHHMSNLAIESELKHYLSLNPGLQIRLQEKQHTKLVLVYKSSRNILGYCGSLNFINPTLCDVMVRMLPSQCKTLITYFDYQWTLARVLSPVHPVNPTPSPK